MHDLDRDLERELDEPSRISFIDRAERAGVGSRRLASRIGSVTHVSALAWPLINPVTTLPFHESKGEGMDTAAAPGCSGRGEVLPPDELGAGLQGEGRC